MKYNLLYKHVLTKKVTYFRKVRNSVYEREDGLEMSRNAMGKEYVFMDYKRVSAYHFVTTPNGFRIQVKK